MENITRRNFLRVVGATSAVGMLAGCGSSSSTSTTGTSTSSSSSTASGSTETGTEKVTIQVNVIDTEKQDVENDPRYLALQEKLNFDYELVVSNFDEVDEKTRLWVGSDDVPEVTWNQVLVTELQEWSESGVFQPIPSLDDYPNLKAAQEKITDLTDLLTNEQGERYFIPTLRDSVIHDFVLMRGYMYRKDWAKALGLYKEDGYTWEEMVAMAQAMAAQDPGGNGAGQTIGLVLRGWALENGAFGLLDTNPNWKDFYVKDGEYVWGPGEADTLTGVVEAKKLVDNGVLWSEQALASGNDGPAKFAAGLAGICYDKFSSSTLVSMITSFKEAYPDIDPADAFEVLNVLGPTGKKVRIKSDAHWGAISFARDTDATVVERVLQIMEYCLSDEGWMLQLYGVEGLDYQMNGDQIELLWEQDESGAYISPYDTDSTRLFQWAQLCEESMLYCEYTDPTVSMFTQQFLTHLLDYEGGYLESASDYARDGYTSATKDAFTVDVLSKFVELIMTSKDIGADWSAFVAEYQDQADVIAKELTANLL